MTVTEWQNDKVTEWLTGQKQYSAPPIFDKLGGIKFMEILKMLDVTKSNNTYTK